MQNLFVILWKFDDFVEERDIRSFLLTPNLSVALDFVKRRVCECFGVNFPISLEDVVKVALRTCIIDSIFKSSTRFPLNQKFQFESTKISRNFGSDYVPDMLCTSQGVNG